MYNPVRRNRNIGTVNQGFGQNNKMKIPEYDLSCKAYYEHLGKYEKVRMVINNHEFLFVIEHTRKDFKHACSVEDVAKVIELIPPEDYGNLDLIVLRQSKQKEQILESVWGRFVYFFEFENKNHHAIVLEAVSLSQKLRMRRNMSLGEQKEFERLKEDGHMFVENKRGFEAEMTFENARNTQLYRTLPHEFGHYVHYFNCVERPATEDEDYAMWEKRYSVFLKFPVVEKEKFAHGYADRLKLKLIDIGKWRE